MKLSKAALLIALPFAFSTHNISAAELKTEKGIEKQKQTPENIKLIKKINNAYYNLKKLGLKSFKCDIDNSIIDNLKKGLALQLPPEDKRFKVLNSLSYHLSMDEKNKFHFEYKKPESTENARFDNSIQKISTGMEQLVLGFFRTWKSFVIDPPFDTDKPYDIKKDKDSYIFSREEKGNKVFVYLDKNFKIQKIEITSQQAKIKLTPQLTDTDKGYIPNGYELLINQGLVKSNLEITYTDVKGMQMPAQIKITNFMSGVQQVMAVKFINYRIEKK